MKLVSFENLSKYNKLLNQKTVRSVNSVKPDSNGNVSLGTEKSTFNKVVYDTGYFSIDVNKTYSFDLTGSDLENVSKENVNIRFVAKVTTAHNGFEVGDIIQLSSGLDYTTETSDLNVCSYIRSNTLYVYSGSVSALSSATNSIGHLQKVDVQIKAVLTAFIPDDGSILLIAEDQTNTSKLIGLPDGSLSWQGQNLVRSVNGVNADAEGNVIIGGLEVGDIALAPLGIDETDNCRRYLNGQVILQSQFVAFTEKLKHAITLYPNLSTTETNWQSAVTLSPLGQCGKFVIDDDAGTIRLPKVVNVMGALDLATIGQTVEAGLPNIEGNLVGALMMVNSGKTGCLVNSVNSPGGNTGISAGSLTRYGTIDVNASKSNPIYGNSETVQQESIKYPYFIQVATSNNEDVQIDTQVRLNNPFSLFMPYWSPIELNNLSWLRSNKQWNNGAVYTSAYEFLLEKYNSGTEQTETIADVSVTYKLADNGMKIITDKSVYDALISASGSAWFFVLDTANTQFILPYTNGFAQFGNEPGKFTEAGLPNITATSAVNATATLPVTGAFTKLASASTVAGTAGSSNVLGFDASKSNPVYGKSPTVQPNSVTGYLYFYVGEVEQDANIIATSGLAESVSRKADNDLSNVTAPTQTFKNMSIGWCMPDWSKVIDITSSKNSYTAPVDGWIFGILLVSSTAVCNAYINGYMIGREYADYISVQSPLNAGDVFTSNSGSASEVVLYFVPCKGVN